MTNVNNKRAILAIRNLHIGGWSTYANNLRKLLEEMGYSVSIFVESNSGELFNEFESSFEFLIILKRGLLSRAEYINKASGRVNSTGKYDLMINISSEIANDVFAFVNTNCTRITTIHSIVDYEIENAITCGTPLSKIICVSKNVSDQVIKLFPEIDQSIITVIPPIIHEINFDFEGVRTARNSSVKKEINIVYVGRLTMLAKRIDYLPMICEKLTEMRVPFHLHVIGAGEDEQKLKDWFHQANQKNNVTMYGSLSPELILRKLELMHAILLTSEYEGLPHSILEAISMGVVPIVTKIKGSTDTIIKDRSDGYLINFGDINSFAKRIASLYYKEGIYESLSQNGREKFNKFFSRDLVNKLWSDTITSLPNNHTIENKINMWPRRHRKASDIVIIGGLWRWLKSF